MGLGFLTKAGIQGRGLFRGKPGRDAIFRDIRQAIMDDADDPLFRRLISTSVEEHTLFVTLHPCAEPVEFVWKPAGEIVVSDKTSTVGPGYHAHVIDLLERLGRELRLQWDWSDNDGGDETGYVQKKDYPALQQQFAHFLQDLSRFILKEEMAENENIMVNMPVAMPRPKSQGFCLTPMGPLKRDWWDGLRDAGPSELAARATDFYPWWNQTVDAEFWRNTGLILMWCDVRWHPPEPGPDAEVSQLAFDCLQRAVELDGRIEVPRTEMAELESFLRAPPQAKAKPPRPKGIGYRRHVMSHPTTGQWRIALPGYFYRQEEEGTITLWHNDLTVQVSSFAVKRDDGQPAPPRDMLPKKTAEDVEGAEVIDYEHKHLRGWATIRQEQEDGETFWQLCGQMALPNSLCYVTIGYVDPRDKAWAIETFKSIFHPPQ
jgi:hypothetical protein